MRRPSTSAVALFGLALATACDFGSEPVGVDPRGSIPVAVAPVFAIVPTESEIAVLDRLRVTLRDTRDSSVVKLQEVAIDPADEEWSIQLSVETTYGQGYQRSLFVETELIDSDTGVESVEWSGRTEGFVLQSPDRPLEFRQVNLYRGPLANLGLTGVVFSQASLRLVEGSTSEVRWYAQGDTAGTVLYVAADDEGVATLDGTGRIETRGIGTTKLFVYGGMVEDSLMLEVAEIYLPSVAEVNGTIRPQLQYVASDLFISTFDDAVQVEGLRDRITDLDTYLSARSGPEVVAAFEALKEAYADYGAGTPLRYTDGPQLGVLQLTLHRVATALRTAFP